MNPITAQERSFVNLILRGFNPYSAAIMLNMEGDQGLSLINEERIREHIDTVKPHFDPSAFHNPVSVNFTKDDAHMMYLEAHKKAKDATEEIKAVDSLVRLHDLLAPQKVELAVANVDQIKELDDKELAKLSGLDIDLSPDAYAVVDIEKGEEEKNRDINNGNQQ
jgi:hypothetical protein